MPLPAAASTLSVPSIGKVKKPEPSAFRTILDDDVSTLGTFVSRWRDRLGAMTHARHQNMLNVILGESMEHRRLFEQAAAGFEDVLGRRTGGVPRQGGVLPTRWLE
jgi:hypothetical protein